MIQNRSFSSTAANLERLLQKISLIPLQFAKNSAICTLEKSSKTCQTMSFERHWRADRMKMFLTGEGPADCGRSRFDKNPLGLSGRMDLCKFILWCRILFTGVNQQLEGPLPLLLVGFVSGANISPPFDCDIDKVSNSLPVDVNGRPQNAASIQKFDPIA